MEAENARLAAWLTHCAAGNPDGIIVDAAWKTYVHDDTDEGEVLSVLTNATGDAPTLNKTVAYMTAFHHAFEAFWKKHGGKTIAQALAILQTADCTAA